MATAAASNPKALELEPGRTQAHLDTGPCRQVVWTDADANPRRGLPSDHCPIAVDLF